MTEHHGKIKTSARGALRPNSSFHGKLDLLYESEITFAIARSGDLHALREATLHGPFDGRGTQYPNLALAAYFASLVDSVTEPMHESADIYDLLKRAIRHLRNQDASMRALVHFESELCRALGINDPAPTFDPALALTKLCGRVVTARKNVLRALDPPARAA